MSNLATLCYDDATRTYSAVFEGKVLVSSVGGESSRKYVISRIIEGKCSRAVKLGVTGFSNVEQTEINSVSKPVGNAVPFKKTATNSLSVTERYELLDECVDIIINKNSGIRSLIITGEGSLGKTFHTKERLKLAGLVSTHEAANAKTTFTPEQQEIIDAINSRMIECKKIAEEFYSNPQSDELDEGDSEFEPLELNYGPVEFDLHLSDDIKERRCAGIFYPATKSYRFNLVLAQENIDEFIECIVPHEVSHQITSQLYPKAKNPHGKQWQSVMTECFNIPADRYHTFDIENVKTAPELQGDYHYMKGYTSAKGLYRTLYENRTKLVVIDDCDAAWRTEAGANILKSALDSDNERWVTWNVETFGDNDLPRSFLFEGRIIFISNVASADFPQPLISRSLRVDMEMTIDERFERMRQILHSEQFASGIEVQIREDAYAFLYENKDIASEISTRSLLNVIKVAATGSKIWKRIALANIT